jgi:hypothetical protein
VKMEPSLSCRIGLVILLTFLQGCTHLAIEDCGAEVLGKNEPRIRSSHFRMFLADLPAASNRFAPYAVMSALSTIGWQEVREVAWVPPCEDDVGLFFRVWKLEAAPRQVVIAFRGTWGFKDWLYGNLHWLTRFLPREDQYARARMATQRVFGHFSETPQKPTQFYATGQSLGGGLAQHVLYSFPNPIDQALAFDPSFVTGFADQPPSNQVAACACKSDTLNGEPRIFRVYDAYEILANLRIFHKTFLPPERHIQEVRFPNAASHSMKGLAFYLLKNATSGTPYSVPWYSGKGNYTDTESCTTAFSRGQQTSCGAEVPKDHWNKCPQ